MSPAIAELLPAIAMLSPTDKFQLVQFVLTQLAQEAGIEVLETSKEIQSAARKQRLRGCLKRYAKPELIAQEQDAWQIYPSKPF